MAAAQTMTREEEFLKKQDFFRRNAFLIINEMMGLSPQHPSLLMDEVLHCIFFLGEINTVKFLPKDIVTDPNMLNELKGRYPKPFQCCTSHLPKRSPVSCVLDMIVQLTGQQKEKEIREQMQKLNRQLTQDKTTALVSSTICVSQPNKSQASVRYYGVSMSTSGPIPGRIIIAAACLSDIWDSYVAGAVMSYNWKKEKRDYFDGTIKLPQDDQKDPVRCEAFRLSNGEKISPCRSCGDLFGLKTSDKTKWPYGNCAEAESVSNLLKKEKDVREKAKPTSETCTEANRKIAKESIMKDLTGWLDMKKFKWNKQHEFYTPQV